MGLGSLIEAASGGTPSLKKLIRSGFKRKEEVPYPTEDSWIRASGFALMCPREEVLCARARITREREIDTDLLLIFEHGHGLHDRLQNVILPRVGVLRGKWICLGCGTMQGGPPPEDCSASTDWAIPCPDECEECGASEFRFFEVEYYNHALRLKGHTDGYLAIPGMPGLGVLEAKSIKPGWQIKNVPKLEHAIQLQLYLLLTGLQWGIILYWIKGENGLEAFVEHFVERDEDTLTKVKAAIRGIHSGVMGGPLPDRTCASAGCPRAADCVVSEACFAEETVEDDDDDTDAF
jgi:hypothetical protein